MAPFAARIAARIRSATWSSDRPLSDPSSRATKRTAISLATSPAACPPIPSATTKRSEEHTSELQSRLHLVCRLLLEKKKTTPIHSVASRVLHIHESDSLVGHCDV